MRPICLVIFLFCSGHLPAQPKTLDFSRDDLKKLAPHPRLQLSEAKLSEIKSALKSDARLAWKLEVLKKQGEAILKAPLAERKLTGPRLLSVSRETLRRVTTLGLLYRLEGDARFFKRAKAEMLAVAAFSDWNPSHFLDVGEMSNAMALGYDWLYPVLSDAERKAVREAIVEKGLKPALPLYEKQEWQVASSMNWNQVCNGGLGIAALALADEEPELCFRVLSQGLKLLPLALASYGSDGGWIEGPSYWDYATRYTVYLMSALESALGKDCGMGGFEGLRKAGDFFMHAGGPGRRGFNYADAKEPLAPSQAMPYLAGRFGNPAYAAVTEWGFKDEDVGAYSLIWHQPPPPADRLEKEPRDAFFPGVNVAFFRSAWNDDAALFAGFKGGDNAANHAHLDLGSFVLDWGGVRWAVDLGPEDYNIPGYWDKDEGGQRWSYFRTGSLSHNTLAINGKPQKVAAQAPITAFKSADGLASAVADLSRAYPSAKRVRRGLAVLGRRQVLVQDEVTMEPGELRWAMMTRAQAALDHGRAVLTQDGRAMELRILSPQGAEFAVESAAPAGKGENPNEGCRMLAFKIPVSRPVTLAVLFTPLDGAAEKGGLPPLKGLDSW